jgi:hypothetical protein
MWSVLERYGSPPKFVKLVRQFHEDMTARVVVDGEASDDFEVHTGVKQGCVLAPTLFALYLAAMLDEVACKLTDQGIQVQYRIDGRFYNIRRFSSKSKSAMEIIRELLFADDCSLVAHSLEELQQIVNTFDEAAKNFGLQINIGKTEFLYRPENNENNREAKISINGQELTRVTAFQYLGSIISENGLSDRDVTARIQKAGAAFGKLQARVWNNRGIRTSTKVSVYNAVVVSILLYGCESWLLYRRNIDS